MAEVLKAGIIADPSLFDLLAAGIEALAGFSGHSERPPKASNPEDDLNLCDRRITEIIAGAVRVKARIVERDPFEQGDRAWLNLGHTFGHALELLSGYTLRHGEAVGLGMVAAAELSAGLGYCDMALPRRVRAAVARLGLPTSYPFDPAAALTAMGTDKKRRGRNLRFVLIKRIGEVTLVDNVPETAVLEVLERIR
jgi:3-dehydroquinate synthetase